MERPSRKTKAVNYSDFKDVDDDDDFASVKAPPSKKARENVKDNKQVKSTKSSSKTTSQESDSLLICRKDRVPLGDKLYKRDLEAALTLSLLQNGEIEEQCPENKDVKDQPQRDADPLRFSNCSVDTNLLGLDKIINEQGYPCTPSRQRKAASKATEQQRCMLKDDDEDYQPKGTPDSESDADFSDQGESDDEEFTVKKAEKTKTNKKKTIKQPPVLKKENIVMLISKGDDGEFAVQKAEKTTINKKERTEEPPVLMKEEPPVLMKEEPPSKAKPKFSGNPTKVRSPAPKPASVPRRPPTTPIQSKPAVSVSPAGGRTPKWNPPAQVGRSPGSSQSASVKSPGQGLRLGLSRLVRVKPLHPSVAGH